ncbi:gM [Suid alphaherpesvirus 1]|nr:gM [Suid alphaherpesvirus 1]
MSGPRNAEAVSWRSWLIEVCGFALAALTLVLTLIFVSLPEMGFPCFYATVADYDTLNDTSGGVWTRQPLVAPALFLETPTVTSFFGFTATVLLAHALYAVAGAVVLRREAGRLAFQPSVVLYAASTVAAPGTLMLGALCAWTLQAVVLLMAHKQAGLAAAAYITHFVFLALFGACHACKGAGDVRAALAASPPLRRVAVHARAVVTNVVLGAVGLGAAVVGLMLGVLLANSFHISLWKTAEVALAVFTVLALALMAFVEVVVSGYVQVLPTPAFCVLVASAALGVSAHRYFAKFSEALGETHGVVIGTRAVLAVLSLIALAMIVVRLVRACIAHRARGSRFYANVDKARTTARRYLQKRLHGRGNEEYLLAPGMTEDEFDDGDEVVYENLGFE